MDRSRRLIHRYLDQLASADEVADLGRLLATSPEAALALAEATRTETVLANYFREQRVRADVAACLRAPQEAVAGTSAAVTTGPSADPIGVARVPPAKPFPPARRRLPWKWCAAALLVAAVGGAVAYRPGRPPALPDVLSGRVLVNGIEAVRIPDGARVEVAGGAAVIRLSDGSRAELAPWSQAVLRGRGGGREAVELGQGGGQFEVEKGGKRFRVETPVGTVTARGGRFSVELEPAEGVEPMSKRGAVLLVVAALVGQVEVHSQGQRYVLAPGQSWVFAGEGKAPFRKPAASGTVVAVAPDGQSITLEQPRHKGDGEAKRVTFKLTVRTTFEYFGVGKDGEKPAVGYVASVWLEEGSADSAERVRLGRKEVILTGTVAAVAADGQTITLESPPKKGGATALRREIRLPPGTKLVYRDADKGDKPTPGYFAQVWMKPGSADTASGVVFSSKKPEDAPKPAAGVKKPEGQKPAGGGKAPDPKKAGKPEPKEAEPERASTRDPLPVAAAVDAELDQSLAATKLPASPRADDAEFLRRVTLDITGRVPSYKRALAFLESKDPDKRRKLIDELLAGPDYGRHFATVWRNLIVPRSEATGVKGQPRDDFSPWLAGQFNRNRGWDRIVSDLLTAEGPLADNPQSAFVMANAPEFQPQPALLAGSTARLFLGVQLRCAECHDHPFAQWKQADFWGVAAFFGRVRYAGAKTGKPTLAEAAEAPQEGKTKGGAGRPATVPGGIVIPASAGKAGGRVVKARFLQGAEVDLNAEGPYRARLAAWLTAVDNPYFANAAVNRLWAHFFGRGFVHPVDGFDENHAPAHPALLKRLADEFVASGYDLKHLVRCVCNSKAYQRTSRPLPGNEDDVSGVSHMAIKVMTPEMFYDSLGVVTAVDKNDPLMNTAQARPGKGGGLLPESREQFARFFRPQGDEAEPGPYSQGIPQFLKLMNAPLLNGGAPVIDKLIRSAVGREGAVETLYLVALSRRPSPAEVKRMTDYLARRKDTGEGYRGVLWILLNSSEFVLNH
jgi:ferric-dicitrate binding protein FerR (iron transport regulator)